MSIYVGHNKEECYNKSWMKIYEDMQNILIMEIQNINMIGKSCIIDTVTLASILCLPERDFI